MQADSGELNSVTENLAPYPMEELRKIKVSLIDQKKPIYDFGTGDPKIPIEDFIVDKVKEHTTTVSGYPAIVGPSELKAAHHKYIENRF